MSNFRVSGIDEFVVGENKFNTKVSNKLESNNGNDLKLKILTIAGLVFSVFLFFSIISYSSLDDANVQTSISGILNQLFSTSSTDPNMQIHNWLGIFGAVLANIFVNGIFGIFSISFPVVLFLWSLSFYKKGNVSEKLLLNSIIVLAISFEFATLAGVLIKLQLWGLQKFYSGNIGLFVSELTSRGITEGGSTVLFSIFLLGTIALFVTSNKDSKFGEVIIKSLKYLNSNIASSSKAIKEKTETINFDGIKNKFANKQVNNNDSENINNNDENIIYHTSIEETKLNDTINTQINNETNVETPNIISSLENVILETDELIKENDIINTILNDKLIEKSPVTIGFASNIEPQSTFTVRTIEDENKPSSLRVTHNNFGNPFLNRKIQIGKSEEPEIIEKNSIEENQNDIEPNEIEQIVNNEFDSLNAEYFESMNLILNAIDNNFELSSQLVELLSEPEISLEVFTNCLRNNGVFHRDIAVCLSQPYESIKIIFEVLRDQIENFTVSKKPDLPDLQHISNNIEINTENITITEQNRPIFPDKSQIEYRKPIYAYQSTDSGYSMLEPQTIEHQNILIEDDKIAIYDQTISPNLDEIPKITINETPQPIEKIENQINNYQNHEKEVINEIMTNPFTSYTYKEDQINSQVPYSEPDKLIALTQNESFKEIEPEKKSELDLRLSQLLNSVKMSSVVANEFIVASDEKPIIVNSFPNFQELTPIEKNQSFEEQKEEIKNFPIQSNEDLSSKINITPSTLSTPISNVNIHKAEEFHINIPGNKSIHTNFAEIEDLSTNNDMFDSNDNDYKEKSTFELNKNDIPISPISVLIHDEDINFVAPGFDLLEPEDNNNQINPEELNMNARILKETMETFRIPIGEISITPGPVVTLYEFVPAPGTKVSKIESIQDDITMALKASVIRIIAPMPGRGTVGIEIPNHTRKMVRFSQIVKDPDFIASKMQLPIGLGMTISGEIYIADLAKMPHLLVAGSTGAGKSVGINTIVNSLLYHKKPDELKFIFVDPKKVELSQYRTLKNHYLASSPDVDELVITEPTHAVTILKNAVLEMHTRYKIFQGVGARNILEYNGKVESGHLNDSTDISHRKLPYIVVIIDELADLMIYAGKELETNLASLAQMARAVGIHLVVATQRPSVNVITGLIKANFPARLAYLVTSVTDSRTILDMGGAEKLLGYGDMLFIPGNQPFPVRIQNAFLTTEEVENVCKYIGDQKGYSSPYLLPTLNQRKSGGSNGMSLDSRDELFEDVARFFIRTQKSSTSAIQRKFSVGFARAGRIMDELEAYGVIGPSMGSKGRAVLMDSESELESVL